MRIEALAAARDVALVWRPFLLGPLFAEVGWRDSPFNIFPAKGRYMWRDMERVCDALGLKLTRPDPFPQNSLLAARVALALAPEARAAFSRAVYHAEFALGRSIADRAVIGELLASVGVDPEGALAQAESAAKQGTAQGGRRGGQAARPSRGALLRDLRWRSVLGQRPARTGARLGARGLSGASSSPHRPIS